MKIVRTQNGSALTLGLEGRLDTITAPELENEIERGLDGVNALTLDLAQLEYISSAGLRVLLLIRKTLNSASGIRVINANELVREVFNVTGFSDILDIE